MAFRTNLVILIRIRTSVVCRRIRPVRCFVFELGRCRHVMHKTLKSVRAYIEACLNFPEIILCAPYILVVHFVHMRERRGAYSVFVGKPEGRRPLGRPKS